MKQHILLSIIITMLTLALLPALGLLQQPAPAQGTPAGLPPQYGQMEPVDLTVLPSPPPVSEPSSVYGNTDRSAIIGERLTRSFYKNSSVVKAIYVSEKPGTIAVDVRYHNYYNPYNLTKPMGNLTHLVQFYYGLTPDQANSDILLTAHNPQGNPIIDARYSSANNTYTYYKVLTISATPRPTATMTVRPSNVGRPMGMATPGPVGTNTLSSPQASPCQMPGIGPPGVTQPTAAPLRARSVKLAMIILQVSNTLPQASASPSQQATGYTPGPGVTGENQGTGFRAPTPTTPSFAQPTGASFAGRQGGRVQGTGSAGPTVTATPAAPTLKPLATNQYPTLPMKRTPKPAYGNTTRSQLIAEEMTTASNGKVGYRIDESPDGTILVDMHFKYYDLDRIMSVSANSIYYIGWLYRVIGLGNSDIALKAYGPNDRLLCYGKYSGQHGSFVDYRIAGYGAAPVPPTGTGATPVPGGVPTNQSGYTTGNISAQNIVMNNWYGTAGGPAAQA